MCKKALNGSKCGILEGWKNSSEAAKLREEDGDKECWRSGWDKLVQSLISHGEEFSC